MKTLIGILEEVAERWQRERRKMIEEIAFLLWFWTFFFAIIWIFH